ncbi:hypothetical protein CSUI_003449 [Cystoisospora suis]|uniref:Uncharacterized protein n=1 Tax=Cystoisospora suis TaxID=483139 RepID=A0A2C6L496_9APIC|nr:hypothetical protein CSUI_003449 [Cystoisospora suis]
MNVWNPSQASCNAPQEPWQAQRIGDVTGGERTPGGEERRGRDKSTGGGDDGEGPEVGGRLLTGAPASSGGASPLQPQQQRLQLLLQLQQSRGLSPPTSEQVARPTSQEPAVAAPRTVEENGAGERNVAGGGLQDGKENKDEEESSDNESEADDDGVSSGPNSEDEEEGGAGGGAAGGGMGGGGGGEGGRKEGGGNSAEHPPRDDGGGGGVEENETSGGGGSDAVGDSKASEGSAEEKGGVDAEELKAASLEGRPICFSFFPYQEEESSLLRLLSHYRSVFRRVSCASLCTCLLPPKRNRCFSVFSSRSRLSCISSVKLLSGSFGIVLAAPFFEEETEAEGSFEKQLCVLGSSHQERRQVITLLPPSAEGITCLRLLSPPASTNALTVFAPSTRTFSFCGRFPLSVTSLSTVPRAWEHRFPSKLPSAPATSVSLPDSQRSLRRMRRRVTRVDSMKFGERESSPPSCVQRIPASS